MVHSSKEKVYIAWCDNGMTDGYFVEGLVNTLIKSQSNGGIQFAGFARAQGIQIAKQRQGIMEAWKESTVDWMLWVDSDVVLTPQIVNDLWAVADKNTAPVISGVYFTFWRPEGTSVPTPVPTIFNVSPEGVSTPVHPLPENQLIEVDYIGMGLVLIHRSIFKKLDPLFGGLYFNESMQPGGIFMSEDGSFCAKLRAAKIPILVHTGIIAQHMKRFAVDQHYYNAYWNKINPQSPVEVKQEIHRP
jgi:hypothetical protein